MDKPVFILPKINFPKIVHSVNIKNIKPIYDDFYGDKVIMKTCINEKGGVRMFCHMKKGFYMNKHKHLGRYEWVVLSGKFRFKNPVTGEINILERGDYYVNPPNTPHEEECLEDGDIFWIYNKIPDHTNC